MDNENNPIKFFELANGLKKNKRTGWITRNVQNAESIADHSWRVALLAMVLGKKLGVNTDKAVKMALVHDLAEAITGDISRDHIDDFENSLGIKPTISAEQKKASEKKAIEQMAKLLDTQPRNQLIALFKEYDEKKTKTARFVKELDSLELLLQALEYKRADPKNKTLGDFFRYTEKMKRIKSPLIKKITGRLIEEFKKIDSEH